MQTFKSYTNHWTVTPAFVIYTNMFAITEAQARYDLWLDRKVWFILWADI